VLENLPYIRFGVTQFSWIAGITVTPVAIVTHKWFVDKVISRHGAPAQVGMVGDAGVDHRRHDAGRAGRNIPGSREVDAVVPGGRGEIMPLVGNSADRSASQYAA